MSEDRSIELDAYEAANLASALQAAIEVDGDHPLSTLNSGDWIWQVLYKAQECLNPNGPGIFSSANRTPEEYKQDAVHRHETALKQQLATAQQELADEKCAYKKLSEQWNRADLELHTAPEQQARLREALRTVLKHLNTCLDDRDIDPDGPIGELYGMMHEWEDLVAQTTPSGDAFDARAAVVELAEVVEASDRLRRLPLAGDVQRAVELKRKAKG